MTEPGIEVPICARTKSETTEDNEVVIVHKTSFEWSWFEGEPYLGMFLLMYKLCVVISICSIMRMFPIAYKINNVASVYFECIKNNKDIIMREYNHAMHVQKSLQRSR